MFRIPVDTNETTLMSAGHMTPAAGHRGCAWWKADLLAVLEQGAELIAADVGPESGGGFDAMDVVRAVVRIGAPLDAEDICQWCEECPDDTAEDIAEAGGPPTYEQAQWHSKNCPWRLADELLDGASVDDDEGRGG